MNYLQKGSRRDEMLGYAQAVTDALNRVVKQNVPYCPRAEQLEDLAMTVCDDVYNAGFTDSDVVCAAIRQFVIAENRFPNGPNIISWLRASKNVRPEHRAYVPPEKRQAITHDKDSEFDVFAELKRRGLLGDFGKSRAGQVVYVHDDELRKKNKCRCKSCRLSWYMQRFKQPVDHKGQPS